MKASKVFFAIALMSASVAAMASGGGDRSMAKMEAARAVAMAHYKQGEQARAVASNQRAETKVKSGS